MKHKLLTKINTLYLLFFAICIFLFFMVLPPKTKEYLVKKRANNLQVIGEKLAEYPEIYSCNFLENEETDRVRDILSSLTQALSCEVWLMNEEGRILLNSNYEYPLSPSTEIPDFPALIRDQPYWITGTFFEMFPTETLSVIVPVTAMPKTTDVIIVHSPLSALDKETEKLVNINLLYVGLFWLIALIFPIAFYLIFYRPLKNTLHISSDYASGNLNTLISSSREDEFGLLQTNLNYMASEIKQSEENQRKFISNISHDFRSPLTSIKGYAEAMLDGTIPKEAQEKYLEIILTESERLTNLTRNILTSNNLKDHGTFLNRSDFDINAVIQSSVAAMEIQCRKKDLQILVDLPMFPQLVNADKEKIQQVIYNLLDNAIKFSYPHSSIRISTATKKKYIFVSIKDNGEGISADELPKIWNRFYKADSSRGRDKMGTGLGLSIVREIIQAHDQHINVVSTKDVGSEFIFTLDKTE